MQKMIGLVGVLACTLWACSDDGAGGASGQPCPEGTAPGAQLRCLCSDAGATGITICQNDNTLSACDCDGDGDGDGALGGTSGGGTGGGGTGGGAGGTAGTSGGGTSGGGTSGGGTGGGGTGAAGGDAGLPPTLDGGDTTPPVQLPTDGNQGSVCSSAGDCNDGLGCYDPGTTGQGFCSAECAETSDCESLTGASYICSMTLGLCSVECSGEDDDASCPDAMECVEVAAGFPPGNPATYRCKYPDPAGMAGQFDECASTSACAGELICVPSGLGADADGYCTATCTEGGDECSGISGGTIDATCVPGLPIDPNRCVLDCSSDADGCPQGMECIDYVIGPLQFSRCGYPD